MQVERSKLETQVQANDIIVRVQDARAVGGCVNGWKLFVEAHGYSWKEVVLHGMLASQLLATHDAMADTIVNYVYNIKDK